MTGVDVVLFAFCAFCAIITVCQIVILSRPSFWKKYREQLTKAQYKQWKTRGGLTMFRFWVERSETGKQWVGRVNECPSLSYLGKTKEQALVGIMVLVGGEIADPKNPLPIRAALP